MTASVPSHTDIQRELAAAFEATRRLRRYVPAAVAEAVLHDEQRLRGERREVAVLFADVIDFTHLSASLDAEPVFDLINDLLGRLMDCIHRYDGVVDKFTGDGLMAVFGAPVAHENDAELAVRAALDMQKAAAEFEPIAHAQLGAPLKLRIGIHSGLAIAGILGTAEQAAYTVIGETVNLAARMEALAQPGCVLVSSRVYHQTRALFNFQGMGTTHVKGIDWPVAVYQAVGDRSEPLRTRGVAGVADVFLGRDAELEQLKTLLNAFLDDRHGRAVIVQGEAGMGKSRLVSEWLAGITPEQAAVWQGRGLPYAQGVGYGIFRSLLQNALRSSPAGAAWDTHVSPTLRPLLKQILGEKLSPDEQSNLRFLEPEHIKQLTALALREWLLGEAQQRPAILILEDFHWADDLSRDLWKSLLGLIDEAPVLFCTITRPQPEAMAELDLLRPEGPLAAPVTLSLTVDPLSPEQSRDLLGHLIVLSGLPEPFVETILTRAQGNPFYIEEFVRMLIEKEVLALRDGRWHVVSQVTLQQLEIPTSLRGLMLTRVDRLPEDLQQVLRNAAVIGLQFSADLIEEILRRLAGADSVLPALERLTDLGVLVKQPEVGNQIYAFRHLLTQETIYESLMRSQRPTLHQIVAECIEKLYAGDLERQTEVLALHYDRARVRDKAMLYALSAGERARARFANHEALEYYSRALQLSQHLSDFESERWQAIVGLGQVQQHIGQYEEAIACYQAGLTDWKDAPPVARAQVMLKLGQVLGDKRGDLDQAERWLREGLSQLALAHADMPDLLAQIHSEMGWISLRRGDLTEAQARLESGLALVESTEHLNVVSAILNRLGFVHYHRSEWEQAVACVEQALRLREQLGDIVGYARSLNNLGILKQISGAWDGALADYEQAVELQERIGEVEGLALACTNLGVLYTERGEWSKAEENLQRSFAIAQRIGHPHQLALAHTNLGRLYLLQKRLAECAHHLDAAIPLYIEAGARANPSLSDAYYLQGRLCLEQNQPDTAAAWAERNSELLREMSGAENGESIEWGRQLRLMGRLAWVRGDLVATRRYLEHSSAILHAVGSQIEAARSEYWCGLLLQHLAQTDAASEKFDAAKRVFEQLGARADLQRIESQLAAMTPAA